MLPKHCPVVPGWQSAAYYQPARLVGATFTTFSSCRRARPVGMVIADVADKGCRRSVYGLSRTMIRTSALAGRSPAAALLWANQLILNDSKVTSS